jgi:DNA-binding NarL/FixJ family response regulator
MKILVVDDHALIRTALRGFSASSPAMSRSSKAIAAVRSI